MLVMDRWGQYFSELFNSKSESSASKNIVYRGAEELSHILRPQQDMRCLKS
jgi:hypothetical protein